MLRIFNLPSVVRGDSGSGWLAQTVHEDMQNIGCTHSVCAGVVTIHHVVVDYPPWHGGFSATVGRAIDSTMTPVTPPFRQRLVTSSVLADLETFPVAVLTGPRQCGKRTLALEAPAFAARPYLTLDDASVRDQAASAPEDLLRRHPIMTLDEVQREPDLLLAVKALVDRDRPRRRGRFLLTGSANLLLMRAVADSLAGWAAWRVMHPMTRREQLGLGVAGRWSALLAEDVERWPALLEADAAPPEDWTAFARRGGFPVPALELATDAARATWFEGYLRTYLERDLRDLNNIQSLPDFRRLMRAAALRAGGLLNVTELGRDVGLPPTTVSRHLGLLETSHLAFRLEPYAVNRTKRLIRTPKLHWVDTGLALHLGGGEPTDAHLEALVISDLMAWADAVPGVRPQVLHWRTASGQEVDAVIEAGDRLLAVEVKATTRPSARDARHLTAFRDEYGPAVAGALLLHCGEDTFRLSDRVVATPWWRVL
jgi:predicted AAA+ superfamily ATPase